MRGRLVASSKSRPDNSRTRALIVACFLGVWMLVIGVRLIYLQTAQHEWLTSRARTQQQDAIETSPIRGLVLDRHGNELARSIDTESFWAVPREIQNVEEVSATLAPLVDVDAGTLAARLTYRSCAKQFLPAPRGGNACWSPAVTFPTIIEFNGSARRTG